MKTIELKHVTINNNEVRIMSSCTCYANERRIKDIDVKHLLKRFTTLSKTLKSKGVIVSHKYKTRKFVADNIKAFDEAYAEYNRSFESMVSIAKVITSKPLPIGTSDNTELKELYKYRNKCDSMLNRSSIISKVLDFNSRVSELEKAIVSDDFNYSKVCF